MKKATTPTEWNCYEILVNSLCFVTCKLSINLLFSGENSDLEISWKGKHGNATFPLNGFKNIFIQQLQQLQLQLQHQQQQQQQLKSNQCMYGTCCSQSWGGVQLFTRIKFAFVVLSFFLVVVNFLGSLIPAKFSWKSMFRNVWLTGNKTSRTFI